MKKIVHNIKTGEIQEVDLTAEEVSKAEIDIANAQSEKTAQDNLGKLNKRINNFIKNSENLIFCLISLNYSL